ncbi:PREDICTED: uncharacterized protein LOC107332683 [Acropora digitifera]|uniref:uncharacterized protein LOC107332683 n=1 Tax=Acropora digitifera TaxID=70779 RepID=UPI00077A17AC|nr:PREDICTED: uncharacterized protein LOC107332683 [Acropora digitifera]
MNLELSINPGCLHYSFCKSLSPGSRKEYDEFSPHSKTTFRKGFALAIRKLQKQNREKPANNTHAAKTPHSSSKSSGGTSKSPQKDQSDNEESEVCHICGQQSSSKKKNWSRHWIACETCKSWTHLECSKRQRLYLQTMRHSSLLVVKRHPSNSFLTTYTSKSC